jgi:serine/threonine-protein kinase
MGVVYLAVRADDQYQKRVAIKLVKRGMDTEEILQRFRNERQILASLDHPNIARLFDGGITANGLPYFVMEYIEGLPIDVYCDRHKLNTTERLKLFSAVCSAVHYAHQHLIVHRDLKPTNILVIAEGVPKLLDFGIAKLLHQEHSSKSITHTMTGMRLMTPEYASPEQARNEPITTASDVYSLGVLLYKLLTGHHPYHFMNFSPREIERVICEQQPSKPSTAISRMKQAADDGGKAVQTLLPETISAAQKGGLEKLRRQLAGDLDNIVLMALHKEPKRRYASVEQFSEDIRRHWEGLPVTAHKDTLGYRSVKFIKRHKIGVSAIALVLITLVAGIAGIGWQARIAAKERNKAELETAKAQQINRFLQEMLAAGDPVKSGKKDITVTEVLAEAVKRVNQELSTQPEIAAEVLTTIGITYQNLGHYDRAEPVLQRALEMHRHLFGDEHLKVAMSIKNMALLRHYQGDLKNAEPLYQQAIPMYRRLETRSTPAFADALNDYGALSSDLGKFEQAKILYRESLAMYVRLFGNVHQEVASVNNNLAVAFHEEGKLDSAEVLYRNALAIYTKLYGAEHSQIARAMNNLAFVLHDKGELDAAAGLFQQSLELRRKFLGNDHPDVGVAIHNLAGILYYQKKVFAGGRNDTRGDCCLEKNFAAQSSQHGQFTLLAGPDSAGSGQAAKSGTASSEISCHSSSRVCKGSRFNRQGASRARQESFAATSVWRSELVIAEWLRNIESFTRRPGPEPARMLAVAHQFVRGDENAGEGGTLRFTLCQVAIVTGQHRMASSPPFWKKPLVIARRFLPKRSLSFKEIASLRNARNDSFLEAFTPRGVCSMRN